MSIVYLLPWKDAAKNQDKMFESRTTTATSSTAQGGAGSFKKTKTIGEIDGCESRMPEQKH